jgi:hypothetical protein
MRQHWFLYSKCHTPRSTHFAEPHFVGLRQLVPGATRKSLGEARIDTPFAIAIGGVRCRR